MLTAIAQFLASAVVIIIAGTFLTKFTDRISELTGLGRMLLGAILLAAATSVPELMVDLKAIREGLPDLATGDLLGSSLFNLLILATLDFSFPSEFRRTAFSPLFLHHGLSAALSILLTGLVGAGIAAKFSFSFLGAGVFAWILPLVYLWGIRLIYKNAAEEQGTSARKDFLKNREFYVSTFGYLAAAVTIFLVAPYIVESAEILSEVTGLGHTFTGTVFLALVTSLPELISTLTAFRIGAPDLAIGNIFGSNAFNMLMFLPLDLAHPETLFHTVNMSHVVTAFSVITVTSLAVMGQLYRRRKSSLREPTSEIIVVVILLSLFLMYKVQ